MSYRFDVGGNVDFLCPVGLVVADFDDGHYPSVVQEAINLAKAAGEVSKAALRGEVILLADGDVQKRREICRGCVLFDAGPSRCRKCGCFIAMKTALAAWHCPIGRW